MLKTTTDLAGLPSTRARSAGVVVRVLMSRLTAGSGMLFREQTPTICWMLLSCAQRAAVCTSSSRVGRSTRTRPERVRAKYSATWIAIFVFPVPVAAMIVARGRRFRDRVAARTASVWWGHSGVRLGLIGGAPSPVATAVRRVLRP